MQVTQQHPGVRLGSTVSHTQENDRGTMNNAGEEQRPEVRVLGDDNTSFVRGPPQDRLVVSAGHAKVTNMDGIVAGLAKLMGHLPGDSLVDKKPHVTIR